MNAYGNILGRARHPGGLGDAFSVSLRALRLGPSPRRGGPPSVREVARQKINLSGSRDQLIPEVRLAAIRLLAPEQVVGKLWVEVDVVGMRVLVDGQERATTPLQASIDGLAPGPHSVVLQHPGWPEVQRTLDVRPFETARLRLVLQGAAPVQAAGTP